ncbi:hypothetical protein D3C78_1156600 [compost metagenome]
MHANIFKKRFDRLNITSYTIYSPSYMLLNAILTGGYDMLVYKRFSHIRNYFKWTYHFEIPLSWLDNRVNFQMLIDLRAKLETKVASISTNQEGDLEHGTYIS